MQLPSVREIPNASHVVLRLDLDVPVKNGVVTDDRRLQKSLSTIVLLLEKQCKIVVLGHMGRPKTREEQYSLRPVYTHLLDLMRGKRAQEIQSVFLDGIDDRKRVEDAVQSHDIVCVENVRYWTGEEQNDPTFLANILNATDSFVNDATAVAHRRHASVMLHTQLPTYYGLSFIEEIEKIISVIDHPKKPITILLGGAKKDKLSYVADLLDIADHIDLGGKLPILIREEPQFPHSDKVYVAGLREDALDLCDNDVFVIKSHIAQAQTVLWVGAMGFYENESAQKGTNEIAKAVAESNAFTIVAGGDTEASIASLGYNDKIGLIASGGGMLLELLTKKSLPAWTV